MELAKLSYYSYSYSTLRIELAKLNYYYCSYSTMYVQCTMIPLSTRSCIKSNKLRPILNGQFYHAIFKNIGLNLFGSKQPREILVFVILKL